MKNLMATLLACALVLSVGGAALAGGGGGPKSLGTIVISNVDGAGVPIHVIVNPSQDLLDKVADYLAGLGPLPVTQFYREGGVVLGPGQAQSFSVKAGKHNVYAMWLNPTLGGIPPGVTEGPQVVRVLARQTVNLRVQTNANGGNPTEVYINP